MGMNPMDRLRMMMMCLHLMGMMPRMNMPT